MAIRRRKKKPSRFGRYVFLSLFFLFASHVDVRIDRGGILFSYDKARGFELPSFVKAAVFEF